MEQLRTLTQSLGPVRLAVLGGVALALAGFFAWMITQVSTPPQSLLYGDLDPAEAGRIVAQLEATGVPFTLGAGGTVIYVPADHVARTRVALAGEGLPAGGSVGYELFDAGSALGTTSFQQNVNLVRALEGELARTIRSIDTVRAARVHLVLPKRELFAREKPEASASVVLQMRGKTRLTPPQVQAVQHIVASAVPGLTPQKISIVDGQGTLLTSADAGGDEVAGAGARADDRRRELEMRLTRSIEQLVERTVGPGKVRAEVSADMDFDRINTSEEVFNPDGQVVRSTQASGQNSKSSDGAAPPVSVSTNLPDAQKENDGGGGSNNEESRTDETTNYEISKKVINHVRETGVLRRLSVAVLVDGVYATAADGTRSYQPRPAEELQQIASLVRTAVGFSEERKDTVEVISMRFAEPEALPDEGAGVLLGLEKNDLLRIGEYLALLLVALLALLLVVKPLVSKAMESLPPSAALAAAGIAAGGAELLPGQRAAAALAGPDGSVAGMLPGAVDGGMDLPEEMIDLDRIEGRVRASTMKRVGEIVSKHPEESLAIVRSWLHAEE